MYKPKGATFGQRQGVGVGWGHLQSGPPLLTSLMGDGSSALVTPQGGRALGEHDRMVLLMAKQPMATLSSGP